MMISELKLRRMMIARELGICSRMKVEPEMANKKATENDEEQDTGVSFVCVHNDLVVVWKLALFELQGIDQQRGVAD